MTGARAFTDAQAMLEATKPDLVDIVTPPPTHRELVALCASRGLPAICQKALAETYDEAAAIVSLAEAARTPLVVHENIRWQPWYREAKRLLDAGTLGVPHSVAFRLRPGDGQGPRAYLDRQPYFQRMPKLLVYETAIHWIDTFRFLLGEVEAVYARLRRINPAIDGEDAGYIVFEFDVGRDRALRRQSPERPHRGAIRAARWARCGSKARPASCASTATRACGSSRTTRPSARTPTTAATTRSSAAAASRRCSATSSRTCRQRRAAGEHRPRLPRQPAHPGRGLPLARRGAADRASRAQPALTDPASLTSGRHVRPFRTPKEDTPCNDAMS